MAVRSKGLPVSGFMLLRAVLLSELHMSKCVSVYVCVGRTSSIRHFCKMFHPSLNDSSGFFFLSFPKATTGE